MTCAETLIRWASPDRGLVHPKQFVPVAKACGLIVPIGRWVLRDFLSHFQCACKYDVGQPDRSRCQRIKVLYPDFDTF
jgi:EAL domain-containing protein (putative c-di-GMP-specific phosphodiesterase class I)